MSGALTAVDATKVLKACIMADEVRFDYAPAEGNFSGLVFYVDHEPTLGACNSQVLDDILTDLSRRVDERGDPWESAAPSSLVEALAGHHSAADVVAALRQGLREGVLHFTAQPTNHYVAFSMNGVIAYTALAVEKASLRGLCLHVRAGNEAVAVRKVHDHQQGQPPLQLLALVPKQRLCLPAFPGEPAMDIVKL